MKKLNKDWFAEGLIDFEYKKYLLLSYLQQVSCDFAAVRLYPAFSELIAHYNNLFNYKTSKQKLMDGFVHSDSITEFPDQMSPEAPADLLELDAIVEFAIPTIKGKLEEGKEIYELIENDIIIEPIGITPLYKKEGYVLLKMEPDTLIDAYEYRIIFFENIEANYHGISLQHIHSFQYNLANSFESIKLQLIRSHKKFPNPATFSILAKHSFPKDASLLPVAKRKFLSYIK